MRLTVEHKIMAGLGVALLLIVIVSFASYRSTAVFLESSNQMVAETRTRYTVCNVLFAMDDLETGMRGYVITGDDPYLEPYRSAVAVTDQRMAELSTRIEGVPDLQEKLVELKSLVAAELAFASRTIELRKKVGFEAASDAVKGGEGKRVMDKIRQVIGAIIKVEEESVAEQDRRTNQQAWRTRWISSIAGLFSTLFVAVAGVIIHRDLSERRRVEEQLRENEERFRLLLEGAKEYAIFMLDTQGRIKTWNAGAKRINGYESEEIIGQHFSRFYTLEDIKAGKPERELETAVREGRYEEEGWRVRKDGSRFWANVLITRLLDSHGNQIGFSKITRDLSERKLAEEQLQNFFTRSLDMLCIAGIDGYFKHINPAWQEILGYTEAELLAKPYLDFVHPEDRAATIATAGQVAQAGAIGRFENRYRCKAGSYRWLTWTASISSDGQRLFASARDVTDQKRAEEEIAGLNKTLLDHNEQLESINSELEAFSYSVSHDLRAPLRSLDGFSHALLEDCADKLDPNDQDNLRRIRGASQRMGHLIDDLLNLSRLTRVEMNRERVDLSKMAREILEEIRAADAQRDAEFVIADGLVVEADPRLLQVALTNLLGNAWKFTSKRPHTRIELGCTGEDGNKAFFVRDNGVGFDMAYSGKLFGAFQRLHAMQDFPGTGIGLATVQRIFRRHGGRVWAESAVEAGATFHFTLNNGEESWQAKSSCWSKTTPTTKN